MVFYLGIVIPLLYSTLLYSTYSTVPHRTYINYVQHTPTHFSEHAVARKTRMRRLYDGNAGNYKVVMWTSTHDMYDDMFRGGSTDMMIDTWLLINI